MVANQSVEVRFRPVALPGGLGTGNLHLDGKNHVRRQLVWAQIEQGLPRVIGYAPRMDDPQEAVNLVPLEQAIPETRPRTGPVILPGEQETAPQTDDGDHCHAIVPVRDQNPSRPSGTPSGSTPNCVSKKPNRGLMKMSAPSTAASNSPWGSGRPLNTVMAAWASSR